MLANVLWYYITRLKVSSCVYFEFAIGLKGGSCSWIGLCALEFKAVATNVSGLCVLELKSGSV